MDGKANNLCTGPRISTHDCFPLHHHHYLSIIVVCLRIVAGDRLFYTGGKEKRSGAGAELGVFIH